MLFNQNDKFIVIIIILMIYIYISRLQAIEKLKRFESTCLYIENHLHGMYCFKTDYNYKLVELGRVYDFIMTK